MDCMRACSSRVAGVKLLDKWSLLCHSFIQQILDWCVFSPCLAGAKVQRCRSQTFLCPRLDFSRDTGEHQESQSSATCSDKQKHRVCGSGESDPDLWGEWKPLDRVQLFATPYTVHGILQARVLEWVAYPFFSESSRPRNRTWGSPALQADSLPTDLWGKLWAGGPAQNIAHPVEC